MDAARPLPRFLQLAQGSEELLFRGVDAAVRLIDVGAARATEGQQSDVVVLADEGIEHLTPLLRALAIVRALAGEHQRAADVRERLQRRRLAARRGRHRLVQAGEPLLDLPERDLDEAELSESAKLEVDIARLDGHVERRRCQTSGLFGLVSSLRAREIEPASVGTGSNIGQQTLGACQPAVRRRLVPPNKRVLPRNPKRDPGCPRQLPIPAEARISAFPMDDRLLRLAQPPQRPAEPVERFGELVDRQRRLESSTRGLPVARRERFIALGNARLDRSSFHRSDRDTPERGPRARSPSGRSTRSLAQFTSLASQRDGRRLPATTP